MGDDAGIEAGSSELEVRVSIIVVRDSTRLPTPRTPLAELGWRVGLAANDYQWQEAGMAGRYELRQRQTSILIQQPGIVTVACKPSR